MRFTIVRFLILIDHSPLLFPAHAFPLCPKSLHVLNLAVPLSPIFVGSFQLFLYICREYIIWWIWKLLYFYMQILLYRWYIFEPIKKSVKVFFLFISLFRFIKYKLNKLTKKTTYISPPHPCPVLTGLCTLDATLLFSSRAGVDFENKF